MPKFRADLKGFEAAVKGLNLHKQTTLQRMMMGMKRLAEDIGRRSQYYCPVSEDGSHGQAAGYLKSSMQTKVVGPTGEGFIKGNYGNKGLTYVISYGEEPKVVFYAAIVHEKPALHEEPTRDKYLEIAVREVIAERGNTAFGGGIKFDIEAEGTSLGVNDDQIKFSFTRFGE